MSDLLGFLNSKKIVLLYVFTVFLKFKKNTKDLLISSEQSERIAQVAQDK